MKLNELAAEFMSRYAAERLRPSTLRGYRINLDNHALPLLGNKSIQEITLDDLYELTDALREKGLSNKSIVYVHATLRKAFNYARKCGYLVSNVYDCYDLPRVEAPAYQILTDEEFAKLLSLADGRAYHMIAIRLALRYGLRRGEILGIRPQTDLSGNVLHVQRTRTVEDGKETLTPCKTRNSNRFLLLLEEDADMLRSRKGEYAIPLTPTQLNKGFQLFLQHCGFPPMRFHDLRHNYATYMYRHGVDVKTISTVLGHSSVKITLDIYAHANLDVQNACLEVLP